jgi:hypothetical protein
MYNILFLNLFSFAKKFIIYYILTMNNYIQYIKITKIYMYIFSIEDIISRNNVIQDVILIFITRIIFCVTTTFLLNKKLLHKI